MIKSKTSVISTTYCLTYYSASTRHWGFYEEVIQSRDGLWFIVSGWWKKTNVRTWSMRMFQSHYCWLEKEAAMCQGNRDLFPTTARTDFCQQPERARKLISASETLDENTAWLTPDFRLMKLSRKLATSCNNSDLQNYELLSLCLL